MSGGLAEAFRLAGENVPGHSHSKLAVILSITFAGEIGCSPRMTEKVLEVINRIFGGIIGRIPSRSTIDDWLKKYGLSEYEGSAEELGNAGYVQIIDESMMIGSQKLALTLGAPAGHNGRPLTHSDIRVLDIATARSFCGDSIRDCLERSSEKVGKPPLYVISDNASIMNNGISKAGFKAHRDITHSLGVLLEHTYKDDNEFASFTKAMADTCSRHCMRPVAWCIPPRQRTNARFINMEPWIEWGRKTLELFDCLGPEERGILSFVPAHAPLLDELKKVMSLIRLIENECKMSDLSKETASRCIHQADLLLEHANNRMCTLIEGIKDFLRQETEWMGEGDVHYNSSDIIESAFGRFKACKSPNKLYGITSLVLVLPVYGALKRAGNYEEISNAMRRKTVADVKKWKQDNIPDNLVNKRIQFYGKAG